MECAEDSDPPITQSKRERTSPYLSKVRVRGQKTRIMERVSKPTRRKDAVMGLELDMAVRRVELRDASTPIVSYRQQLPPVPFNLFNPLASARLVTNTPVVSTLSFASSSHVSAMSRLSVSVNDIDIYPPLPPSVADENNSSV